MASGELDETVAVATTSESDPATPKRDDQTSFHGATTARFVGAAVGYGPALALALLALDRVAFGPLRATLCGRCGRRLKNLVRPECPGCGASF